MARELMTGNEAISHAAILAGCECYFGYPITPQNEITETMSRLMADNKRTFIQSESEIAAINMCLGAGSAGVRTMTSSSSPGISLKQEGISYLSGSEVPVVIVNMVRGGPGLGGIHAAQGDYFQAVKGGGHGDYNMIVFGPDGPAEAAALTQEAFYLADKYRSPVLILGDGLIGQMQEPVEVEKIEFPALPEKTWAASGRRGRGHSNIVRSLYLAEGVLEVHNIMLQQKFAEMAENEVKVEEIQCEDADIFFVAYGTCARILYEVVPALRKKGYKAGLIRPITLWPFPAETVAKYAEKARFFFTVEMAANQLNEDIRLHVAGKCPVYHFNRLGSGRIRIRQVLEKFDEIIATVEKGGAA